ncbi:MAG: hypothetical protein NVSMB45_01660 [Ginsengibacter sp.]
MDQMQIGMLGIAGILIIVQVLSLWIIFEKADQPGWKSIVPVYNLYIMLKIAGKPGWWLLLFLIPGINVLYFIWMMNMISKSFGKDELFTAGMVVLGFIFIPLLAFSDDKYQGPYGDHDAFELIKLRGFEYGHQYA